MAECACGRTAADCASDPRSRLGAAAMVAAARGPGSLPLDAVLDPAACLVGVMNNLATLGSQLATAQSVEWLERYALGIAQTLESEQR